MTCPIIAGRAPPLVPLFPFDACRALRLFIRLATCSLEGQCSEPHSITTCGSPALTICSADRKRTAELVQRVGEQNVRSDDIVVPLENRELGGPFGDVPEFPRPWEHQPRDAPHKPAAAASSDANLLAVPPQHAGVSVDDEPPARRVAWVAQTAPGLAMKAPVASQLYGSPGRAAPRA